MNNSEYWRGRFSLLEHSTYKTAQAALREIEALYRQALYHTRKELDSWCARFADDNGVSLTEARRLLGTKELEEFRWNVAQYIETAQKSGLDETWQRQLRNASARVHISRLEAVETQIRQQIEELYAGQETRLTEAVRRAAEDAYTGTLQEAARGLDIRFKTVSIDKSQLDALTSKAWTTDERTFRDRCWTNKNALVQAIHKGLTQGLLRGDSPAQLTDTIAKQFDVDRYKAGRLVYTETAYYSALAEKQGFKDLGVEKVEIIGTLDGSTCSICGQLDGKEIPLAQYEPGVTVPPFHPRCRCTTAPVIPEDFADGLRIARDEDGEEYYLPAGMKWKEWKQNTNNFFQSVRGSGNGEGSPGETIHKYLGKIDPHDTEQTESLKNMFCERYASSAVENMMVITKDGEVHFMTDNNDTGVDCSYLGDKLKGSYNIHTHPPDTTQYSFSTDADIPAAFSDGTAVMEAVDYKYRYRFVVPKDVTFEQWEEARVEVDNVLNDFLEEVCMPDYSDYVEMKQHTLILETCKRLGINCYSRWKV